MENIILQIFEKCFKFNKNMNFTDMTESVYKNLPVFATNLIKFTLEEMDQKIKLSNGRRRAWDIIRIDKRTIKTIVGVVTYNRRYYRNKKSKEYSYLLDETFGISKYQRLGVILESKILKFANFLSFENAGKLSMDFNEVSKQTVKNIVKKFSEKEEEQFEDLVEKRIVKSLYIEADEDHVSLQKQNKNNTINKLVYVHEGKLKESKNRKFLLNRKIFASNIKSSEDLWIQVYDYMYSTYDMTKVEHLFILGDGARWIKTGVDWIENSQYVLDSFHLNKAILKISGGQSRDENKKLYEKLKKLIYSKEKKQFKLEAKQIIENEINETVKNRKIQHMKYILNQWAGIVTNLDNKEKHQLGCSAEGHVSHILSSRMSSRPLSWSKDGLEGMTKLRVSISNGTTIDDLIKTMKTINKNSAISKFKKAKYIKRIRKAAMETLGNIPVLSIGKVNGLQTMMSELK